MLILTRNTGESIQIDDNIEIKILDVSGNQVKIGIDAPETVDVHRREVYIQIQNENTTAASLPPDVLNILSEKEEK